MTQAENLAEVSNMLVYSAMFVLTLAMVAFAAAFAGQRQSATVDVREAAPVTVPPTKPTETASAVASQSTASVERGRRFGNIGMALSWLAFALLLGGVITRGMWAGRVPWGNMYEFSITAALAVLGVFLFASLRHDVRWLGVILVPLTLLTLGLAVTVLYTEAAQLVPALQSYWLVIHVSIAIVCAGAFTFSGSVAALYLVITGGKQSDSGPARGWRAAWANRLPSAERLDRLSYRTIAFTFPLWTFAIVAGAIWAESAWGRYWGWDPKETWAFITWVVYAAYLHARSTAGWKGRRAAWIAVTGTAVFWFNYFGVNLLFSGLHSYSGV